MKIIKALLLLTIVISLSSCFKDNQDPERVYAIRAGVDGNATTFTDVTSSTGAASGANFTKIQGKASDGSVLAITINGELVEGKTYSTATVGATLKPVIQYTAGSDNYFSNDAGTNMVSVTVTEIGSNFVEGTFNADLATVLPGTTIKTKSITNGVFTFKAKKQE